VGPRRVDDGYCILCALSGPEVLSLSQSLSGIYDPTNGTVSRGKVARTSKGEFGVYDVTGSR